MKNTIRQGKLNIDVQLFDLVQQEIAPGTGIDPASFWNSLSDIVSDLAPRNHQLLAKRDELQRLLDAWHLAHRDTELDPRAYHAFLQEIGYLVPVGEDFEIATKNVDAEIAQVAGPQLVVPVDNARYALNAANARWGSLFDALYGTDVISEEAGASRTGSYNPVRGARVFARAEAFLDEHVPLGDGSYTDVQEFLLTGASSRQLAARLKNGSEVVLRQPEQFVGYLDHAGELSSILLRHHGLHIEIQLDRHSPVGKTHPAGIKDVLLESAMTTIMDCEDSVAAVDAADKVHVYRNWLGIMRGTLTAEFDKGNSRVMRRLNPDKRFQGVDGKELVLPGRSLLLIRNVGMHMLTDAVTTHEGEPIPEGFLEAMVTALAALHDLRGLGEHRNSRVGSMYIVKPKMHGPEEVAATVELFSRVEAALSLPPNALKIGIMDEERRTTVNLKECIRQAAERIVFINTGFLDRTGDEIHSVMEAGPVIPKMEIKQAAWMLAYEDWNVDVGIAAKLPGRGQIGKGMWAIPDQMQSMLDKKIAHPQAGANTAWVPSPTAATLHAIHYHAVHVPTVQAALAQREPASLQAILTPCLLGSRRLSSTEIERELENNAQSILGYVVRWVEQGIGCSKVPDIHNVGLMEDRATLRISSQHIANWLHHGLITRSQVEHVFEKMARIVDEQNSADPAYRPMAPDIERSMAFQAALELVFCGRTEPNGYTERVLTARRREVKDQRNEH